jgi:hypothetical protein
MNATIHQFRKARSVDSQLRDLFAREDALVAELAAVKREQRDLRPIYARERGLQMWPSLDVIRKVLGA